MFTESESPNVVTVTSQTAGAVEIAALDWSASDLRHDVTLTSEVFITQAEEVVDDKSLITVPDSVEVDIVALVVEEEERQPAGESIKRNNEQDPHNPSLFCWVGVESGDKILSYKLSQNKCCWNELKYRNIFREA